MNPVLTFLVTFLVIVGFQVACGTRGADMPAPDDVSCKVIKFSSPAGVEASDPVCGVECAWKDGVGDISYGFASSLSVPCSWYGHPVVRR